MISKRMGSNLLNSDFYKDILEAKDSEYLIEKYILHNVPYYFKDKMDLFFDIKKKIATKYNIPITNIYLVGSGQLGFSLSPRKDYRNFIESADEKVGIEASDLDFAIISEKLFGIIWDEICDFRLKDLPHNDKDKEDYRSFQEYLFKGWIRPDTFPFDFSMKKDWFEFFKKLNPLVGRKVAAGIFRNEASFLKQYKRSINELINIIQMEKIQNENELGNK